jgi:hypothetical protein
MHTYYLILCIHIYVYIGDTIPIIPDIAIHYRCGDNVPSKVYGFLPFTAIIDIIQYEMKNINNGIKHIYILTDPPHRVYILDNNKQFALKQCPLILASLFSILQDTFPNINIVLKKGKDPFLDYARLSKAKVTICSVSTFCLWPAIANHRSAYFPVTSLVGGWKSDSISSTSTSFTPINMTTTNMTLPPNLGDHFHWIYTPRIITEFKECTPIKTIIGILRGEISRSVINMTMTTPIGGCPKQ